MNNQEIMNKENSEQIYHLFTVDNKVVAVPTEKSQENIVNYFKEYGVSTLTVVSDDDSVERLVSGDCGKFVDGYLVRLNYEAEFIG